MKVRARVFVLVFSTALLALVVSAATAVAAISANKAFATAGSIGDLVPPIAIALLAGIAAGLLAAALASKSISRPMERLESLLKPPASGSLDFAALLNEAAPAGKGGSVELLFADLAESLNESLVLITRSAFKFNLFASDISFSAGRLADQSGGQAAAMERISAMATDFERELQAMGTEFSRILARIETGSDTYGRLAELASGSGERLSVLQADVARAVLGAAEGREGVVAAAKAAAGIRGALESVESGMGRVSKRALDMTTALALIEDVAERTSLLAINASIEAARAGERGKGFAVIAGEVKKLSESVRSTTKEIAAFLRETMSDIGEAHRLATASARNAAQLAASGATSEAAFAAVEEQAGRVESLMGEFAKTFAAQKRSTEEAVSSYRSAIEAVHGLSERVARQASGYAKVRDEVRSTAEGAATAALSARILSQLGTYLRVGGFDLGKILRDFRLDEERAALRHGRHEKREALIYNLEVIGSKGETLGYVGDISLSGIMLWVEVPLPIGIPIHGRIRMPLSMEGERFIDIIFVPRRSENQGAINKLGCSTASDSPEHQAAIMELINTLGLSRLGAAKPAPAAKAPPMGGDDVEELESID